MSARKVEITLSSAQVDEVNSILSHKREGTTFNDVVAGAVKQGLYQFGYRYDRNKVKWARSKSDKALLTRLLKEEEARLNAVEDSEDEGDIIAND